MPGRDDDDEREERRRQAAWRAAQSPIDRMYPEKQLTEAGDIDLRANRRTGRKLQISFRLQPRTRHLVSAIVRRDKPPSLAVLFEQMLEAYLKVTCPLDDNDLPSEEEAIEMYLEQRGKRDAE